MDRVERAIQDGRCVMVLGGRVLAEAEVLGELRRRPSIPAVVLSGDPRSPATVVNAESLAPALTKEGGLICLIEVESVDSVGLGALASLIQSAPHKPRMVVVARAFNPFGLPSALRTLKFEHEKKKAKEFLFPLPVPVVVAPVVAAAAPAEEKKKGGAPRGSFIGREEELAELAEILEKGGPVVIAGPHGIGKHWLLERALSTSTLRRLPDFSIGWGSEADSLYARLAAICADAGDKRLVDAMRDPANRPIPSQLAALAVTCLENPALDNSVMVIDHLEHSLRGDGTFHREGRLELLLKALLLSKAKLRIVFLSTLRTRFYREGEGVHLPVMELKGLKGRDLHPLFESWRVEDFPREHFGDIINRIHGHPFAARMFAIAVRNPEHREELMEQKRFFQMESVSHLEPVARRIAKAIEALSPEERKALVALAHFRLPMAPADLEHVGVDRKLRLSLQGAGLLDQSPEEAKERSFSVHPLVIAHLDPRERAEFALLEQLGNWYVEKGGKAEGLARLALNQEGNRFLYAAHRIKNRAAMPFPDNDPALESVREMVRSRKPRFDLAEQRLAEILGKDVANTEMGLMKAELRIEQRGNMEEILAIFHEAQRRSPTPEAFHQEATWHQIKAAGRGKAALALERGVEAFPESGRIRRRLAGIYLDQGRVDDAVEQLKEAMRLEPMMPDTYGILGEIYLNRGAFDLAEQALEEARRLDPESGLHMARFGALLVERGVLERQTEAEELLRSSVERDKRNYMAHIYLARITLAKPDGDLDQADWLLKQASKLDERAAMPWVERARIAVRKNNWADATGHLDKAIRMEPSCHQAFFVRGTMYEAQGHIFNADQDYQRALERSPKDSAARLIYGAALGRMQVLITSGAAIELQKQAEAAGIPAPTEPQPRSGSRTVRRRKGGDRASEETVAPTAEGEPVAGAEEEGTAEASAVDGEPTADATVEETVEVPEESASPLGSQEEQV